jgi:hypothetical protein
MIKIRSSDDVSEPTLVALDATLTTSDGDYAISSDRPTQHCSSSLVGGLFGSISWAQWRFRLAPQLSLEQQLFLPSDGSAVALAWQLNGGKSPALRLSVTPLFAGCGPRSYREVGFCKQPDGEGGRLTWLPNVLGPKIIADTNGRYFDGPAASDSGTNLMAPGNFQFDLSGRPSVLIFARDAIRESQANSGMGMFLAGLLPSFGRNSVGRTPTASHPGRALAA